MALLATNATHASPDDATVEDTAPPNAFLCPITQLLMEHPVTTTKGNTFEYSAISQWFSSHNTDPATNEIVKRKDLIPAHTLRSMIQEWAAANPEIAEPYRNSHATAPPDDDDDADDADENATGDLTNESSLGKILKFKGQSVKLTKAQRISAGSAPPSVTTPSGQTYEFRYDPDGKRQTRLHDDNGGAGSTPWMRVPVPKATSVFLTPQGHVIFYKPGEVQELRKFDSDDQANGEINRPGAFASNQVCKFGAKCSKGDCPFKHPFACRFGTACRNPGICKFLHPEPSSAVPLGQVYPLNTECKYGTACTNKTCHFAHPRGRLGTIERKLQQIFATHNADLTPLSEPVPIDLGEVPAGATKFQFDGEFCFFYTPYPGAWAKEHFKTVSVHRFDAAKTQTFRRIGDYDLNGHYCNSAVGNSKYFVLSWWPFEDEAMRSNWEAERQLRSQAKTLQSTEREAEKLRRELEQKDAAIAQTDDKNSRLTSQLKQKDSTIAHANSQNSRLKSQLKHKDEHIAKLQQQQNQLRQQQKQEKQRQYELRQQEKQRQYELRQQERQERQREYELQKQEKQRQYELRKQQQQLERAARRQRELAWQAQRRAAAQARNERFRLRDPIHIWALEAGKDGNDASDWHLILDYHKGAHDLELSAPFPSDDDEDAGAAEGRGMIQRLRVTENNKIFDFDLVAPGDLADIGRLPIVPGRLCDGF